MSDYGTVPTGQLSEGRLWLPAFSFALLKRSLAVMECTWDMGLTSRTLVAGPTSAYTSKDQIEVRFPDDWDWDADLGFSGLELHIELDNVVNVGAGVSIRWSHADATPVGSDTLRWTSANSIPTGWTTINLQVSGTPGDSGDISRTYGGNPDCYWRFYTA